MLKTNDVIKKLMMMGIFATINQRLEKDMLEYSTDLFSVAAIMYRMVTGENFCSAENIDKIEVPGFSILTYQLRQFFKCGLEYNY